MRSDFKFLMVFVVAVILSATGCTPKYTYETVEGDPLKTRIYTLDNGLKVYMAVNKEKPRIQTYIAVRVGSKNDPAETTGLAHYFEHLMFKGTEQFGTQNYDGEKPLLDEIEKQFEIYRNTTDEAARTDIYRTIDSLSYEASKFAIPNEYDKLMSAIGAEGTNAYTSYDMTVYVDDIPSNQVDNWAKIQADRFKNNVIRGFHTELETVYEEKNMSLTRDSWKVMEKMFELLFPSHPYGTQSVIGTQEHLKNPSITNIKNYYRTWYVPNNMAVCLSGDFDPEEMIATIDKYFGDMLPNYDLPHIDIKKETPITSPQKAAVVGVDAENVTLAWRTGGYSGEDADVLNILTSILYNGKAGLIDLDLNQQQKTLTSYGYFFPLKDHGSVVMYGRPKAGQTLDEVKDLLLEEMAKLRNGDFDEDLLEATINNYKAYFMSKTDSNNGRADWFVEAFVNDVPWKDEVEQIERLSKITKQQIVEVANRLLKDDNYVVVYKEQGKDPNELKIDKPEITPIFLNRDTASRFLADIQETKVKPIEPIFVDYDKDMNKLKAKSDIPVLYGKNATNGLFELVYIYETGSNNDPAMNIAFDYLQYLGTSKLSPEQIKQEFYKIACSFSVSSASERSYVTIRGLSENMERAAELFESLLADAQPNEMALENMKADILKGREDAKLNQSANFSRLRTYALYGPKSPVTNILSVSELKALSSAELLDRIKKLSTMEHRILYYGPDGGNDLIVKLNRFHNVPETLQPVPESVKFPYLETAESQVFAAQYDAKQIYYTQISNRGEKFDYKNDPYLALYNEYFGGSMNSIVFQEMRESRGLAYSASANLSGPRRADEPYTMMAFIATQNDKMIEAIEAFQDIIDNMPESEAAFAIAKEALITRLRTERVIKSSVLWSYIYAEDMGVDFNRNKLVYEAVQDMTFDDVKAFQEKWVKGRKYNFCILGDLEDLDIKGLSKYGPVKYLTQEEIFGY